MAKFIGRRSVVGIGVEATRGVGVAPSFVLGKTSYDLDDKANKARSGEGLGSISGEGTTSVVTQKFAEGSIEFEVGANSFGAVLKAVFGSLSSAAESAGYKHTLTLLESNQHPSLSVTIDEPNGDLIFERCMIDSFELGITQDDIVMSTIGIKSKASADSSYSADPALDYKFVGRDLTLKVAANVAGLGAATAICAKELNLTINKNTDFDNCLGTLEPEDILNKQFTIQGSLTLNYEDRTWRDYMLDGDVKALSILLEQSRDTAGDQNPTFYLELPKIDFSEWESSRDNDEIVGQSINFTALYDVANDRLISDCYVINDTASY